MRQDLTAYDHDPALQIRRFRLACQPLDGKPRSDLADGIEATGYTSAADYVDAALQRGHVVDVYDAETGEHLAGPITPTTH